MTYEQRPRIAIFTNKFAGQPIKKKDGSFVTKSNGENLLQSDFSGKINLPEGLPAGDYEVNIYKSVAKSGLEYMSGTIKPAFKKIDKHSQDKGNGYQEQPEDSEELPY